jgi:hypothetical protein
MTGISMMKLGQTGAEVAMIKLGDGLPLIPLDSIKDPDWQRRWAVAQSKHDTSGGQSGTIKNLVREAREKLGADFLIRAAQRDPRMWGVGTVGEHGGNFRSLANEAEASASSEKKKESVKGSSGHEKARCPYCGR